ncbi:ParA family protein [Butyrivibrio sp.]|uniref:ParA family protein n=1 Tax=Butyrivibrio sp. TaxID=28121 RepID=UPI0025C612FE|nr:ParA family protein [Butyrivibrio sp.]MBQ9302329.1 ParA family protein [Butyrivibrio sp.]
MGKVIGVINQKGGVGKTTATIDLANAIAQRKRKVLVIDLDQQGNLSKYTSADSHIPTIYEVLQAEKPIAEAVVTCGRIDVIPSSKELSKADKEFVEHDDIFLLSDVIELIRDKYDFIFIDNGPARSTLLTMAYVAADYIIIPAEADDGSLDGVDEVYNDIIRYRQGKRPITKAIISMLLLNRYENTVMHQNTKEALEEKSENFEDHPCIATIRKGIVATECKSFRQPVIDYDPNGNVAQDYMIAAKKLIMQVGERW